MGERELYVAKGLFEGVEKHTQNLYNLTIAKDKIEKDRQIFDLDMKIKKLQLKKEESSFDPERLKIETDLFKSESKYQKAQFDFKTNLLADRERVERKELQNKESGINILSARLQAEKETLAKNITENNYPPITIRDGGQTTYTSFQPKSSPALTPVEKYRADLRKAQRGEITWDELKSSYSDKPEEIDKLRKTLPDLRERTLQKNPNFKKGYGLEALWSKDVAKLNPVTRDIIDNKIKTPQDLKDLLDESDDGILSKKVDVKAVLEAYGVTREQVRKEDFAQQAAAAKYKMGQEVETLSGKYVISEISTDGNPIIDTPRGRFKIISFDADGEPIVEEVK